MKNGANLPAFKDKIQSTQGKPITSCEIKILQVNLGYQCNMACKHCHVQAGPNRSEMMDRDNIDAALRLLEENDIETLDVTGGAPELNPHFHYLIKKAKDLDRHVIVRSNLTIFFEKGMEDLPEFYRENNIEMIASLPYYMEENVDRVRGRGTFQRSMKALQKLNSLGYGTDGAGVHINLVYNPQGAFLPPPQATLEEEYKEELGKGFGISFNKLYTFTNMPIGRFKDFLLRSRNYEKYLDKLICAFNPETLDGIMCTHLINVGWDGTLYDCDFNQMMGLPLLEGYPSHIKYFNLSMLSEREIAVDDHCYGCTAGQGST